MNNIFEDDPPFDVEPEPGCDPNVARAKKVVIGAQLRKCGLKSEVRYGSQEMLHLGTCVFKWAWCIQRNLSGKTEGWPDVEQVELRHILIDPSLRRPDIREAKWVAHRLYMNAYQLRALRDDPSYNMPSEQEILDWFKTPEEQAKTNQSERKSWDLSPEFETASRDELPSADPLLRPLEVVEYWNNQWCAVVLNRKKLIRKMDNEWRKIPFASSYYKLMPGQFYGLGVTGLIANEQRLQQGVINNYNDKLSLDTSGMWGIVQGRNTPSQNMRVRPGANVVVSEKDAIFPLQQTQVNPQLLEAMDRSESRAEKWTAANDFIQGAVPEGGTGITRTAKGISSVSAAAGVRIEDVVDVFSEQVMLPILEAFDYMNRMNKFSPSLVNQILNEELGEAWMEENQIDPKSVVSAQVKYKMLPATKMKARRAMKETLPSLDQFLMQDSVQSGISDNMKVFDVNEWINMHFDAAGWTNKETLIRPMTQEEQAKQAADNPMVQQLMQNQQMMQLQTNMELQKIHAENEGRMARDIVKDGLADEKRKHEATDRLAEEAGRNMATSLITAQGQTDGTGQGIPQ